MNNLPDNVLLFDWSAHINSIIYDLFSSHTQTIKRALRSCKRLFNQMNEHQQGSFAFRLMFLSARYPHDPEMQLLVKRGKRLFEPFEVEQLTFENFI